jgi:hypothetical protein
VVKSRYLDLMTSAKVVATPFFISASLRAGLLA